MNLSPLRTGFASFLCLFLVSGLGSLRAQDENKFSLYTIRNGLSDNYITGVVQDTHGYIWVGTRHGLNRYDGKQFVQYHTENKTNSLPDEGVIRIVPLDKNRLAAYTGMGIYIINSLHEETGNIIIPAPDPKYVYKFNIIMSVLSDNKGNIFVLTRSGFYEYDTQYKLVFRFEYYNKEETETSDFEFGEEACWLSETEILVHAIDGSYIYNTNSKVLGKVRKDDPFIPEFATMTHDDYLIRQTDPESFLLIKNGTDSVIYINKKKGIKRVSKTGFHSLTDEFNWQSQLFKVDESLYFLTSRHNGFFKLNIDTVTGRIEMDMERYLSGYYCNDFVLDHAGRLWVGTNEGLLKETSHATSVKQVALPKDLLKQSPAMKIRQILGFRDKLYVACVQTSKLLVYDKKTLSFLKAIPFKIPLNPEGILSLLQARGDTIYVGTDGPLYWLKTSTDKTGEIPLDGWDRKHNWISCQYKDRHGNIWISTNDESKYYLLPANSNKFKRLEYNSDVIKKVLVPYNIREDHADNIWVSGHGICRINQSLGKPDLYLDSFPRIRFGRKEVTSIAFDKRNVLWAGIITNGLIAYFIDKGTFRHFTTSDGLPDNYVRSICPIGNKLWIAAATGIASMDLRNYSISNFSGDDGFSPLAVSSTDFYYDSTEHYLYSGFTTNIVRFDPDSLSYAKSPPTFFIESIHFLNDTTYYHPGKSITVPYFKNDITVEVNSINYDDVDNQRIAYRIVNSNDLTWQPLAGNLINFNNLPPGTYHLQVKLFAANNRWRPQIKDIDIVITPPFWKTDWFVALTVVAIISMVYLIYLLKVRSVRKTERAKVQVQELKTEEYKYRLELEKISHYFSSSLSGKKSVNEILWGVAGKLIGEMGYEDCMIYLWNADRTKMVQKAGYGPKGTPEALTKYIFEVKPGQGLVGHVMQTKRPIMVGDTRMDKRYRPDEMFRLSEICVPIIHNGQLLGVIDSEHQSVNYYKERDLKLLTTIATLLGNKIKQVEFEESLAVKHRELATINEQLAEAQLTALQAQMNPHFIFNALNSIKRMILDNENKSASKYLSKFAQMIRLTLNHSKETFVTLEETVEYLHAYLGMEQLRFGSSFSYKIEIIGRIEEEDIFIPTLMIQPLAENAIWHGLMHKAGDKNILIQFIQQDEMVTCIIEDNGIGIRKSELMNASSKRPHVGLDNLRNRIKIMNEKYDMNCSLEITDLSDDNSNRSGTLAVLRFKILTQ